jgi:hypothetical protein
VEGVTIIESFVGMRHGDPLGGHLFALAHYRTFLETIMRVPNYVYPSLADDIHIVGPMNEITCAFDHLSTQLTLVGLKIKVSKCKLWNPSGIFPSIEILQGRILATNGLRILGVLMGFQDFATHFLDEALSQDVLHIDDFPLLGDAKLLWAFCVATPLWPSVGVKPNTSKVGDLESSGTPECLELDNKAQNTSH